MDQKNTSLEKIEGEETNIFDEFSHEQDVGSEIKKIQEEEEKDVFFYIRRISTFVFILNVLFFLTISAAGGYLYIQNTAEKKEFRFLSSLCSVFLGKQEFWNGSCYGLTAVHQEYIDLYNAEKMQQTERIVPLLGEVYSLENFNASRKVSFLLDTEKSRLRPSEILNGFDKIKYQFSPDDKLDVVCENMEITQDKILSVSCTIYSSDWDSNIVSLNEGNVSFLESGGTSASRASSFINFIENKVDSPFSVLEKTQTFTVEEADLPPYTKKTSIQLQLEYKDFENLYF